MKVKKLELLCILVFTLCTETAFGTDYFFGPKDKNVSYGWTSNLNLILRNKSTTTIVLELNTRPSGFQKTELTNQPIRLKVFPAQVMLKPGQTQYIDLSYIYARTSKVMESYELNIEQLPIHYTPPGARKPITMSLRNYTANILVRPRQKLPEYMVAELSLKP
ncbi:MAG: hypothetical protein AB3N28_10145 [Kordiimonas sp.]